MPADVALDIEGLLRQTQAVLDGHFVLSSGLHSARYVQCARLLEHPRHAETVGRAIAARLGGVAVDVVVGPALGGILVAHEIARALGVRCLFAERKSGPLELRRGFAIEPGERVLVAEDVVTTGGSARETAALVERLGGVVVGYGAIVDRSGAGGTPAAPGMPAAAGVMPGSNLPLYALQCLEVETFDPAGCPLCAAGTAAIKPGSKA